MTIDQNEKKDDGGAQPPSGQPATTNDDKKRSWSVLTGLIAAAVAVPYIFDAMRMHAFGVPQTLTYSSADGVMSALSNLPTILVSVAFFIGAAVFVISFLCLCAAFALLTYPFAVTGYAVASDGAKTLQARLAANSSGSDQDGPETSSPAAGNRYQKDSTGSDKTLWQTAWEDTRNRLRVLWNHSIGVFFRSPTNTSEMVARGFIFIWLVFLPLSGAYAWQYVRIHTLADNEARLDLRKDVPWLLGANYEVLSCVQNAPEDEEGLADVFCRLANEYLFAGEPFSFPLVELTMGARHGIKNTRLRLSSDTVAPVLPFRTARYRYLGDFGEWTLLSECHDGCTTAGDRLLIRRANIIEISKVKADTVTPPPAKFAPPHTASDPVAEELSSLSATFGDLIAKLSNNQTGGTDPELVGAIKSMAQSISGLAAREDDVAYVFWQAFSDGEKGTLAPDPEIATLIAGLDGALKALVDASNALSQAAITSPAFQKELLGLLREIANREPDPEVVILPQFSTVAPDAVAARHELSINSVVVIDGATYEAPLNSVVMPFFVSDATSSTEIAALRWGANLENFDDPEINQPEINQQGEAGSQSFLDRFAGMLEQCLTTTPGQDEAVTIELDVVGLASTSWRNPSNANRDVLNRYLAEGRRFVVIQRLAELIEDDRMHDNIHIRHHGSADVQTLSDFYRELGESGDGSNIFLADVAAMGRLLPSVDDDGTQRTNALNEVRASFVSSVEVADNAQHPMEEFYARSAILTVEQIHGGSCAL